MSIDPDNFEPELNDGTHVFCFGSNLQGTHGDGAAKEAAKHWGAKRGIGEGRTGMAYALPTKETPYRTRSLKSIRVSVSRFLDYARSNPDLTFLVTKIGCGYAGYRDDDMAPMFVDSPENCILPTDWKVFQNSHKS